MTALSHELEIALRAETPRPSEAFAQSLEQRVAEGFPRERKSRRLRLPFSPLPALAGGAGLVVAVVIAVAVAGGGSDQSGTSSSATSADSAASTAAGAPKAAAPSGVAGGGSAFSQAQPAPATPRPGGRDVERSASLTLGAPSSKLDTVANGVVSVTDRHHGFVLHSTVTTGSGGSSGGSFELRVPTGELQGTLSDLSGLADVRSRTQASDDITAPYNSVAGQLDEARALRHSLLARLAKATTDTEAQALRRRIHLASAQIRSLTARFNSLQNRARLATIDVSLVRERAHHSAGAGGLSGDFHDALHSLAVSFGIALRVLGVALPLALLAALGWLGAALLKRRRREAALS
jgi:Domain of unknown function (DUF4349)